MLALDTLDITVGGLFLVLVLVVGAVYLARKDRVTRVKLGIFFEREREREDGTSEPETKIMWPGQRKEEEE